MKITLVFEDHDPLLYGAEEIIDDEKKKAKRSDVEISCFFYGLDFLACEKNDTDVICYGKGAMYGSRSEFKRVCMYRCPDAKILYIDRVENLARLRKLVRSYFRKTQEIKTGQIEYKAKMVI